MNLNRTFNRTQSANQLGDLDNIARTAVWLASDDSCYVNGITFYMDDDIVPVQDLIFEDEP